MAKDSDDIYAISSAFIPLRLHSNSSSFINRWVEFLKVKPFLSEKAAELRRLPIHDPRFVELCFVKWLPNVVWRREQGPLWVRVVQQLRRPRLVGRRDPRGIGCP